VSEYYFGQFPSSLESRSDGAPKPWNSCCRFVLQAFSRNYLGGCNPGVDAHIIITGGISRLRLAEEFLLKQSLVSGWLHRLWKMVSLTPGSIPTSRATPASRCAVKGTVRLTSGLPRESLRQPRPPIRAGSTRLHLPRDPRAAQADQPEPASCVKCS
jgi:hypothetical protein